MIDSVRVLAASDSVSPARPDGGATYVQALVAIAFVVGVLFFISRKNLDSNW